MISEVVGNKP